MGINEVINHIGENSGLAKELAKSTLKAARQGKIPVALAAIGVTMGTGLVVNEIVSNVVDDESSELVGEVAIDVLGNVLEAVI